MIRVLVAVLHRSELARLRSVIHAIEIHSDLDVGLLIGGSMMLYRAGSAVEDVGCSDVGIESTFSSVVEGSTYCNMAVSCGMTTMFAARELDRLNYDVVLLHGDRFDALGVAIAASYQNIVLAHIQGGELSGSIDDRVRHAITKLSDVHFVSTKQARVNVIQMGEDPLTVHCTGCPSLDVFEEMVRPDINRHGVGPQIDLSRPYFIVVLHPDTERPGRNAAMTRKLVQAVLMPDFAVYQILWFAPNIDAESDSMAKILRETHESRPKAIRFIRHLPVKEFAWLLANARAIVGNSSAGIREAGYLGVPALDIGSRQRDRERDSNVLHVERDYVEGLKDRLEYQGSPSLLYGKPGAGKRIAELLASLDLEMSKRFYRLS